MNKTFCYFGMVLGMIVFALSLVLFILPTSGDDASKVKVVEAAVALAALFGCYRAWHHYRHPEEPKGWEWTKSKIEQMNRPREVLCYFFNPKEARTRTAWSLVIILILALFCKPVYAWAMAALFVGVKGWLLLSELRYQKVYHRLQELENTPEPYDYHHEDASMTVEGEDIVIIDPCYLEFDFDDFMPFECNGLTPEMGFRSALSFSISDYRITEIVDNRGRCLGSWDSDSNTLGCFLVEDLKKLVPTWERDIASGIVIPKFSGEVRFHFEEKKAPWTFYGDTCEEDTVVLTIEGRGSLNFHSEELPQEP